MATGTLSAVADGSPRAERGQAARAFCLAAEDGLSVTALAVMTLLPLAELTGRMWLGRGISGAFVLTQQLTLWIALLGAALAARSDRLLALSTPSLMTERWRARVHVFTSAVGTGVALSRRRKPGVWSASNAQRARPECGISRHG